MSEFRHKILEYVLQHKFPSSFKHPGGPEILPGSKYIPNEIELEFTKTARNQIHSSLFRGVLLGTITSYLFVQATILMVPKVKPFWYAGSKLVRTRWMLLFSFGGIHLLIHYTMNK